jgi:hypothetical protein
MNADLALASIATRQRLNVGDDHHRNVILSPAYGQLNYYAPVLLFMGHEYRIPACQYLARGDDTLGQIQKTRYRTPHGEQLLFELGGYAYLWCDENAPVKPLTKKLSFHFPSVDEAYLRGSWKPDGLLVGVRNGEIAVHAGGQPILIEPADWHEPATGTHIERIEDTGLVASIHCTNSVGEVVTIELRRPDRLLIRRRGKEDWQWWCQGAPTMRGSQLNWMGGASLRVVAGEIRSWEPRGYAPILSVGFGKLKLADPTPKAYPKCTIRPAIKNETVLEVRVR